MECVPVQINVFATLDGLGAHVKHVRRLDFLLNG